MIQTSYQSLYDIFLQISLYSDVYSYGKLLHNRALLPNGTLLQDRHVWLYETWTRTDTPVYYDRLVPKRELRRSMAMLVVIHPACDNIYIANIDAIGRHILSNIKAYHVRYIRCDFLEAWEFFESALQVRKRMTPWEYCTGKEAKLKGYADGSMTPKKPESLHQDSFFYFNI
jgi:hypothetical protein